jgi:two-component system, NarL family, invasion response regulator UvrY
MQNLKIVSIDDHSIVRFGLQLWFKKHQPDTEIFGAENEETLLSLLHKQPINIILLDIVMPRVAVNVVISLVKKIYPNIKIILYSSENEPSVVRPLIALGIDGYVNKNEPIELLNAAIKTVIAGEKSFSQALLNAINHSADNDKKMLLEALTAQERLLLQMFVKGKTSKEICNIMNLHASTVSTYKNRIFTKLGVENIAELIAATKDFL